MSPKSVKRRPSKKLKKTRSRSVGPSLSPTEPSSPTEPYNPSPGVTPNTQREELYKEEAQIAKRQQKNHDKRIKVYNENKARGVKTPPTVLTSREGPIMYIQNEDGIGYREATSSDTNDGIYYINNNGSGPQFYKSGLRKVKPLPLKFLDV